MKTRSNRVIYFLAIPTILLLLAILAMLFTNEMKWDIFDIIVMGILLFSASLACERIFSKLKNEKLAILFCGLVLLVFFLIYAELAVGVFGTALAGS